MSRRQALAAGSAGLVGAAASLTAQAPADTTKVQGPGTTDVGARSPHERPTRVSFGGRRTRVADAAAGSRGHHHAGRPALRAATTAASRRSTPTPYSLLVHGLVERPLAFTLDDFKRFPG